MGTAASSGMPMTVATSSTLNADEERQAQHLHEHAHEPGDQIGRLPWRLVSTGAGRPSPRTRREDARSAVPPSVNHHCTRAIRGQSGTTSTVVMFRSPKGESDVGQRPADLRQAALDRSSFRTNHPPAYRRDIATHQGPRADDHVAEHCDHVARPRCR